MPSAFLVLQRRSFSTQIFTTLLAIIDAGGLLQLTLRVSRWYSSCS